MVDPLEGNAKMYILGKCKNVYLNVCRLLLLSYVDAKCILHQKVIYNGIVEQLSELLLKFHSGEKKTLGGFTWYYCSTLTA
jgi:hypothetical protein